jgi:peptidyl-prolyl cis-trans isomerase B (cyclophilin B)
MAHRTVIGWQREGIAVSDTDQPGKRGHGGGRGTLLSAGLGVLALSTALAGCSSSSGNAASTPSAAASASASAAPSASPSASPAPSASAGPADPAAANCEYRKDDSGSPAKFVGYPPKHPAKAALKAKTMTLKTNRGDIVIDIDPAAAPCTINSFYYLAKKNFFDNTVCFRLTTVDTNGVGLLQCGDPQAKGDAENPTDGQGSPGYLFQDENLGPTYNKGVVFMAQGGEDANSNGSQFAISTADDTAQLPTAYTPFGIVEAKSMTIVDKIVAGGVKKFKDGGDIIGNGGANAPKMKVLIKDVVLS